MARTPKTMNNTNGKKKPALATRKASDGSQVYLSKKVLAKGAADTVPSKASTKMAVALGHASGLGNSLKARDTGHKMYSDSTFKKKPKSSGKKK